MSLELQKHPMQDKSQELSGRREEERERGIYIQRSRAAPLREEAEEEEGEEEKELEIAAVLIQKEIQPKLGSIVIQRFEYFVLCFGAPVLRVGAIVLWCLSRGAQGLVNLLNSQVVFGVGRCAYLLGFFELLNSKRLESSCSSLYCTCASGSSVYENDSSPLLISFVLLTEAITFRPRHRLPPDLKPSTSSARNFLRVSPSTTLPDLQNLFLLDSMASSTVSDSVGGYGAAFLTAEEQARFASVKAKLCGHKAVDLADLEKNRMGSLVEALQRLKWMKIATLSDVSYPDLVKAFYVCLKTEEDGTLTSMVKGTQIRITRELLASLFEVSTSGRSGVHTVDTHVKVSGVWSKTGAVEGEAILGETQEDHEPVAEAAAVAESVAAEDIPPEDIEPIGQFSEAPLPSSQVGSLLRDALDSISQGEPVAHEPSIAKSVVEVHAEDVVMEEAPSQQEQVKIQEDVVMEDAPIEGEQSVTEEIQGVSAVASSHTETHSEVLPVQEEEAAAAAQTEVPVESVHAEGEAEVEKGNETQGAGNENPPENQFREGETASSSDSEDDQDQQPPMDKAQEKGKAAKVLDVPLLADTPYQRQMRQRVIINLKPVIERLDAQGEILCSLQSDVNSIFMSQASVTKEISQVRNAMKWFNKEMEV
ncbi:hypothetical protein Taro_039559 [Colocasia esculenta]|uniref:Uncharacterized protein n=1 Tax=Colocasia esculenta TaxID=4460 RepID=A0A843WRW0_COLES|nr:hypothetical protein [Colocasia esculenta]